MGKGISLRGEEDRASCGLVNNLTSEGIAS